MKEIAENTDHFRLVLDGNLVLNLSVSIWFIIGTVLILLFCILIRFIISRDFAGTRFEIDEAEFGIGSQKIKLKPNNVDRQIAFKIWVELSTRKIGLPLDLKHDVISDVYDSWYEFFSVTRELIKDVPVTQFRRPETERIIRLSIDLLNSGLRPHLTQWHSRFRRWFETQLMDQANQETPLQEIQAIFPGYEELKKDLLAVNDNLIGYRNMMYKLMSAK